MGLSQPRQEQVHEQPSHSQAHGREVTGRQEESGRTGTMPLTVTT